ncbi:Maleamate amidohydrolase [Marinibacterium anthonyi]|nr:Maleamate amidohydrolase [Marinibacterium anthonyi]
MTDSFSQMGYGDHSIGYGRRCGVVVVDFQRSLTDPSFPMGDCKAISDAVERTAEVLAMARAQGLPVATCYTGYSSARDALRWKIADVVNWIHGSPGCEIDARVFDKGYDTVFAKRAPSIFFETGVNGFFVQEGVDTVIVTGCTTSGCIRASVIDAFSHGFRVVVPEDCCGDYSAQAHANNLADIGRRYCDVTSSAEVLKHLSAAARAA